MAIRNVLIVDDSKTELMFMTDLLQKKGFAVQHRRERRGCLPPAGRGESRT